MFFICIPGKFYFKELEQLKYYFFFKYLNKQVYLDKGHQYEKAPATSTSSGESTEPAKKRFSGGEGVISKKRSGNILDIKNILNILNILDIKKYFKRYRLLGLFIVYLSRFLV
jgi:hypothetical protein